MERGQAYTHHVVIACACMDRPAADMCAGRVGHAAKKACGFGGLCVGATCAGAGVGDDTLNLIVLPKKGKFVPGKSTVTWHRLLDPDQVVDAIFNEPDVDAIRKMATATTRLRGMCRLT